MMLLYIISLLYLAQLVASKPLTERDATNKKIHEILLKSERKNADPFQFTWIDKVQADIESSTQEFNKAKAGETNVNIVSDTTEPFKNDNKKNSQRFQEIMSDLNRIYSHSVRHVKKEDNNHTTKSHKANHSSKTRTRYKNKTTQAIGRLEKYSNGTIGVSSTISSTSPITKSIYKRKCRNRLRNIEQYLMRSVISHPKESTVDLTEATSATRPAAFEPAVTDFEASTVKIVITVSEPLIKDTTGKEVDETGEYRELTRSEDTPVDESFKQISNVITNTSTDQNSYKCKKKIHTAKQDKAIVKFDNHKEKTKHLFTHKNKNGNTIELKNPQSERFHVTEQEWDDLSTIEEEINDVPNYVNNADTIEDILHKISEEIPIAVTEESIETQLIVKDENAKDNQNEIGNLVPTTTTVALSYDDDVSSMKKKLMTKSIVDSTDIYLIVNKKDQSLKGCFTLQAQPSKDTLLENTTEHEHNIITSITMRNIFNDATPDEQNNTYEPSRVQNQKSVMKLNKLNEAKDDNSHKTNPKKLPKVINLPNAPYVTHVQQNQTMKKDRIQELYKEIFSKNKCTAKFKKIDGDILPKNVFGGKANKAHVTKISNTNNLQNTSATNIANGENTKEPTFMDNIILQDADAIDDKILADAPRSNASVPPDTAKVPQDVKEKGPKKKISGLSKEIMKTHGSKNSQTKIMKHLTWKSIKQFFGHDRVCNCKCKPNKTMCRACAASDAVMRELTFEFTNLAQFMKEHCTEIQTYFWMNPSGGKKLRDSVHMIDKSLNDYYKRIKGKCEGRTCETFATYMDKRHEHDDDEVKNRGKLRKPDHNQ